jgi:hypothetical protein
LDQIFSMSRSLFLIIDSMISSSSGGVRAKKRGDVFALRNASSDRLP